MDIRNLDTQNLSAEQRKLVEDNLGLVAVHLRRNVRNLSVPRRDRERDDLFQEGCLGLIEAARRFDPARGIPFASFALIRIHHAISQALHTRFSAVAFPRRRKARKSADPAGADDAGDRADPERRPRVHQLSDEAGLHLRDRRRPRSGDDDAPTVGDRLREKYERAVRLAADEASRSVSARGDRGSLVRVLTEERLLVPDEDSRRPLRQIARDTDSSFSRVTACEQRLHELIRRVLEHDPEYRALRACAKDDESGMQRPMDEEIERRIMDAGAEELLRRLRDGDDAGRADVVRSLLEAPRDDITSALREGFRRLSPEVREKLLHRAHETK